MGSFVRVALGVCSVDTYKILRIASCRKIAVAATHNLRTQQYAKEGGEIHSSFTPMTRRSESIASPALPHLRRSWYPLGVFWASSSRTRSARGWRENVPNSPICLVCPAPWDGKVSSVLYLQPRTHGQPGFSRFHDSPPSAACRRNPPGDKMFGQKKN